MHEPQHLRDDDPSAPWIKDPYYHGMQPPSARASWEAAQRRSQLAVVEDTPSHEPPLPNGPEDYGGSEISAPTSLPPQIVATPWTWRDPATIPPREALYDRHLFRGFVSGTAGAGGTGKSTLVTGESLAMATGRPLLGKRTPREPLRVWLWNLEDPAEELDRRIAAQCQHFGITPADLGDRLHVNSGRDQPCVIARMTAGGATILVPVIEAIVAEIKARRIDVLTIDPFVSCHQATENDNNAQDAVVKAWGSVADKSAGNCAVELVHHVRKLGDAEATAESVRGAVSFIAGCRDVRVLNRMTEKEAASAGVDNHRLYFRVYSDKSNLAPPSDKSDWYRLGSVDLGNGGAGESDHVQIIEPWQWPNAFDDVTARDLLAVQKRIAEGQWRANSQASDWAGKAVAEVLDLDLSSAPLQTKTKTLLKTWIESGALKPVMRLDEHRKEREFIEVGQWAV